MSATPIACPLCGTAARMTTDTTFGVAHQAHGVECSNFGECEAELTGFASADAAVAKWTSRRVVYAHRNGETEAPAVPGLYWFRGQCHGTAIAQIIPAIKDTTGEILIWRPFLDDGWYESKQHFDGQWWGPIAPPWGQSA